VEALNVILLPSALVFLVLLANDKAVLGPWTNGLAQNWVSGVLVWTVLTFSLAPLVTTFFPNVTLTQCLYAFIVCTVGGLAAGAVLWRLRPSRHQPVSPDLGSSQRPPGMGRREWREILWTRRAEWRTPAWRRSSGRLSSGRRPLAQPLAGADPVVWRGSRRVASVTVP
jgi:hypothetical protein